MENVKKIVVTVTTEDGVLVVVTKDVKIVVTVATTC